MAVDFWDRLLHTPELGLTNDSGFATQGFNAVLNKYARGEVTLTQLAARVTDKSGNPLTPTEKTEAKKLTDLIDLKAGTTAKLLEAIRIGDDLFTGAVKWATRAEVLSELGVTV